MLISVVPAHAVSLVVDDFEDGVADWTTNDKVKAATPGAAASLVNVLAIPAEAGGARGSKGAALFTFKAAKGSWASASLKVDGAEWAKNGAQRLTFWLSAGGDLQGFDVVLRGRTYGPSGAPVEETFALKKKVDLDRRAWRLVSIPLSDFASKNGTLPSRLSSVYLLQIVQTQDWDARFFTLDDIRIEGSGVPIPQKVNVTAPTPVPVATPTPITGDVVTTVNVDFLKKLGRVRSAANVSLGMTWPGASGLEVLPLENRAYRDSIAVLKPRLVRLDAGSLCALVDSSKPSFDFAKLVVAVRHLRDLKIEPLIALTNPVAWGLDEKSYAAFATQAARAVNSGGLSARLFEVAIASPDGAAGNDDVLALAYYNAAYGALKAASKNYWVGGIGASGGRAGTLQRLLSSAKGLDFLTLTYNGAAPVAGNPPGVPALFASALTPASLNYAAGQLDKSRFSKAPIFVTQANLGGVGADGQQPFDPRTSQMASAAWWTAFMGGASRVADQIFHNDGANAAWGLLDGAASAPRGYPAFYAMYLWNNFVPTGSERVKADVSTGAVAATAVNVPVAGNPAVHAVMLSNLTGTEQTVKVSIRGFPVLREARSRVFEDLSAARSLSTYQVMAKSPFQTVTLKPYAVAVLQFIEPPKK